jgi:hypothetical protein
MFLWPVVFFLCHRKTHSEYVHVFSSPLRRQTSCKTTLYLFQKPPRMLLSSHLSLAALNAEPLTFLHPLGTTISLCEKAMLRSLCLYNNVIEKIFAFRKVTSILYHLSLSVPKRMRMASNVSSWL